jgi:Cu(I)/Ag(I) efflux system periplasmic protein CusF
MNLALAALPLLLAVGTACQGASSDSGEPRGQQEGVRPEEKTWETRGVIKRIERERQMITIAHENIPGYMPPMTMPFWMESDALFEGLVVGDTVEFRFRRGEGGKHYIVSIEKP